MTVPAAGYGGGGCGVSGGRWNLCRWVFWLVVFGLLGGAAGVIGFVLGCCVVVVANLTLARLDEK
jgi:ABC-type branched-subunit amino acid transport system permease subunit